MSYLIPHPYQKYSIEKIINNNNIGLFLDMGLGKTAISLMAVNDLKYNRFQIKKVLVIAPKKVAEGTWQREAKKWDQTRHLRFSEILGTAKERQAGLMADADIYMINRENVQWLVDLVRNKWPFDMVIVDESSSFKNPKAKRFKSLVSVRKHINRMVILTGTPSPNSLMDLWSQIYLLDEGQRLGKRFTAFRDNYFRPGYSDGYVVYNYLPRKGAKEEILKSISDICISMKAQDYLQLPDCIMDEVPVKLDKKARKAYDEMEKEMVLELDDTDMIDATSAAALSNKLLQLANGAIYDEDHEYHEIHNCKIEAFMELVESLNGKSALVFYNFKSDKDRLLKALSKTKLKVRELKTDKDQTDWNNGKIDILLTHPASSGYGLNLQEGGSHIIWFGLNWALELYQQANKRLHRQGQKNTVFIHHLVVENSRDEDVMKALNQKEFTQDFVLQSLKARIKKAVQK